ncbi:restriction endonuclease subunit S [Prevotella intermedia]|uniref:Restriction endonuclease subunit S n=1 Tax=Prevotella intermedia TaxID=28131 RepID=A0A2D3LM82_PREIN|nr:restriction endonuclease subunit S [Prevotella intermedia]ATV31708.1 restriction endonuclease subunit S [Prevotella intermedia]
MEYVKVKDLGQIVTGNTPSTSDMSNYGDFMPFIKATDIILGSRYTYNTEQGYSEKSYKKYKVNLVPKGSTCIVTIGSIGKKMTQAHTDLFVNQAINAILPYKQFDKDYIYYVSKYAILPQLKIYDSGTTSGRENISKSSFSNIKLFVEENLPKQQKIASILSTYDTLIENNNRRIRLLEQMAENLYKEWFVRFRFPGHEKLENGLPKEWDIRIKDLTQLKSGYAFKSSWFVDEGEAIAKIKDIGETIMDTSSFSYVSKDNCIKAEKFLLTEGDLTIALTGATIGKISIVPKHKGNIYTNQRLGKFFLGKNPIEKLPFLYCLFKQKAMVSNIINLSNSSSAQPNISPEQIESIKILGDKEVINSFNKACKHIFSMILSIHSQNTLLTRQRDLLLPRLMSGKLEVKP